MDQQTMDTIAKRWSKPGTKIPRTRFWESQTIKKHIGAKICPEAENKLFWQGEVLKKTGRTFKNALSIGCGNAGPEISLLKSGIVEHFDFFELSPQCIMTAKENSKNSGVKDKCSFHCTDFFESGKNKSGTYDLVYWSGSLHHMFNAKFAVMTSYDILKDDGWFFCYEYVGKSRFQFTPLELAAANGARLSLPQECFNVPGLENYYWKTMQTRPNINDVMQDDPSEAADSENIIPAIRHVFPHAEIVTLGGVIYDLALLDVLTNIPEESPLLQSLLALDDDADSHGLFHYAFTLTPKKKIS